MEDRDSLPIADQLTQRELEILRLITDGLSNQGIAERLFITVGTVKWYLKQIYGKLHVSSRTQAIAAIRASRLLDTTSTKVEPSAPPHNLPHQRTPFIGRSSELAAIARRLEDPTCRLLTVIGPGGIGKTRLALQAAQQKITAFTHGVYFISLAPLSSPDSIVSTIAEAIRFSFYPSGEPRQQLLDYLQAKQMLIVLDNFEHLLAGVSLVNDILETALQVKILVTSRERLNVQGETLFSLDGMTYPAQDHAADSAEFSAVQLFLQNAAQVQPDLPITADNLSTISRICRQVQGMPLGILLAAAWVGVLSVQEIAGEIQKSLDFLETDQRDLPERQRSLRAAFAHSWKLLAEQEREVFKKLSVFRGSFTREAAEQVSGASLKVLMALVNKSLLRRDASSGRYEIHELLRQFGEQQLNALPHECEHVHDLHCAYYADYMKRQWKAMFSLRQGAVFDEIRIEFNNVTEAWNHAVEKYIPAAIRAMAWSLFSFCDHRIPRSEGRNVFGRAAKALELVPRESETMILTGLMLSFQTMFCSDPHEGQNLVERGLEILQRYDCPEETAHAWQLFALTTGFGLRQYAKAERAMRGMELIPGALIAMSARACLGI